MQRGGGYPRPANEEALEQGSSIGSIHPLGHGTRTPQYRRGSRLANTTLFYRYTQSASRSRRVRYFVICLASRQQYPPIMRTYRLVLLPLPVLPVPSTDS